MNKLCKSEWCPKKSNMIVKLVTYVLKNTGTLNAQSTGIADSVLPNDRRQTQGPVFAPNHKFI